jgi:putative transposase
VSVASFIASQRADHGVPHALSCRALEVSESWFYKWHERPPTARQLRRAELDRAVAEVFEASGGRYGSPRVHDELLELAGRSRKRRWPPPWRPRAWWPGPSAVTAA